MRFTACIKRSVLLLSLGAAAGCGPSEAPLSQAQVQTLATQSDSSPSGQAAQASGLSAQAIAQTDLPPEGTRSLFDHFAAQNQGVPYPFEKLVESLTKLNPDGQAPVVVMLPHGRSLLKGQSDDTKPRVLLAADFQVPNSPAALGVNMRGQLFLGFTENANEIEVLSYNEAAGRFEFQLVQDYSATGARKLVYAKRQICLTCHQGGAPIFSQRPWNETNASTNTVEAMLTARQKAGLDPHSYLGLPTRAQLSAPERFDELTDVGNFFATTQKLWLDGCGTGESGVKCRKTLLKLALQYKAQPGDFSAEGALQTTLRSLQAQALGEHKLAVAESDLVNRDPLLDKSGLRGFLRQFLGANVKLGDGAKNNEDLAAFDKLPKLPVNLDPLTPRAPKRLLSAQDIDAVFGVASLITDSDVSNVLLRSQQQMALVHKAVDALPNNLFAPQPFERVKLVSALMTSPVLPGPARSLQYAYTDVSEMSPPVASGEPPLQLHANSVLKPYEEYCFSCHRGNPVKKLNFFGGDSEDKVLAQLREKSEIRDALDWSRYEGTDKASMLMPPRDSAQYGKLREHLKTQPDTLARMRDAVPSLFGF